MNRRVTTIRKVIAVYVLLILWVFGVGADSVSGQNVAINTTGTAGHSSAGLDVSFTNKGLLIPRVSLVQTTLATPVTSPATSLMVYNTATINDVVPGYYYWGGSQWIPFATGSGSGWLTTGNAGTNSAVNFIGTLDNVDWCIRTNNTERIRVSSYGHVGIGALPVTYTKVLINYASTSLDNTLTGQNVCSFNSISHSLVTNNALVAGAYNSAYIGASSQLHLSYRSGLVCGAYNDSYVSTNTGSGVFLGSILVAGKNVGAYNVAQTGTNDAYGRTIGALNYSLVGSTQPVNGYTLGTVTYSIVNSPNSGRVYGEYVESGPNGVNNAGGTVYGSYINTQSNGNNNGAIYGIYNLAGSNGTNNTGAVRYGIYNTWTENGFGGSAGNSYGIYSSNGAIGGSTNTVYGIYSEASGGAASYAGYFQGTLFVNGNFTATGTKAFTIDHPLDPDHKYLKHYSVESNEVSNFYSGTVITGADSLARVELPDYFESINTDIRYQLTVVGQWADAVVWKEAAGNRFEIKTSAPGVKVSWMIIARRNDLYMQQHPATDVVDKLPSEQGKYLMPALYQAAPSAGIHFVDDEQNKKQNLTGDRGTPMERHMPLR